mgnify:CR=1 FL=1
MYTIVIADDHHVVAEGVARLIEESKAARVVAIAGTIGDTAQLLEQKRPDLLLLDVAMPDGDGIDAIKRFVAICPDMRVVVLTIYAEPSVVQRAVANGANGYLLKNVKAEELIHALTTVAKGGSYICKEAEVMTMLKKEEAPSLTMRERQVLKLIVEGHTMKEIANILCLGFETVHSYTKYLRQKLGAKNTASLVRKAIEQHLIS